MIPRSVEELPREEISLTTFDGSKIHARVYGPSDAPAVVLVHGWCCRVEYWDPQVADLAQDHRVIVFDQRGHGRNTQAPETFCVEALGHDLQAVLAATLRAGQRALLVGHSLGGITIMSWAQLHADTVERHAYGVLLAGTGVMRLAAETEILPFPDRFGLLRRPLLQTLIGAAAPWPPRRGSRGLLKRIALTPQAPDSAAAFVQDIAYACPPSVRAAWGRALNGLDMSAGVSSLVVPTAVIVGEKDRMIPPRTSSRIVALLRETGFLERSTLLPGVGHCLNVEAPEEFNAEVRRLAAELGSSSEQAAG